MVFLVFWDSIPKRCKGVHCVDLGESFPTHILLQSLTSIQPLTSPFKFARSPRTDPPGHQKNALEEAARGEKQLEGNLRGEADLVLPQEQEKEG